MMGPKLLYYTQDQIQLMRDKVFDLLENHGVKLDPHKKMFKILDDAGARIDATSGIVRFPKHVLERFVELAPKQLALSARHKDRHIKLPRPDGTFYARSGTGAHGWVDPETNRYRKVEIGDLTKWARLINSLEEISFAPFLFPSDVPTQTADIHGLSTLLKNTDKHVWVQPYSTESVEYLIRLGAAAAGGMSELKKNPVISMIACSLTPRCFKTMDLEIIFQSARAGLPIHVCSLPGIGGTAPITLPAVIILATAEILALLAMAQAVTAGTSIVACPIFFSTDMRTGRSLQSSVEAIKGASCAVQFIKAAFNLPTHSYGFGSDAPIVDGQSICERSLLCTLMGISGIDVLGGAGQLEVATAVSPLQLIFDNELIGMVRRIAGNLVCNDENFAWNVLTETEPGGHFLASEHTLKHCRDAFTPQNFVRINRDDWHREGSKDLMDRILDYYHTLGDKENQYHLPEDLSGEIDSIVRAADKNLVG